MTTETRERPIAFKPPLVRAIRAGRKTQTRRIMNPQPVRRDERTYHWHPPRAKFDDQVGHMVPMFAWRADRNPHKTGAASIVESCPYGVPGDVLWVREGLQQEFTTADADTPNGCLAVYSADGAVVHRDGRPAGYDWKPSKLSARFMPRWAARLRLRVTGVRAERLRDISEADAIAEGFGPAGPVTTHGLRPSPRDDFFLYWDLINDRGSLDSNPWVWVVDFEPIEGGAS